MRTAHRSLFVLAMLVATLFPAPAFTQSTEQDRAMSDWDCNVLQLAQTLHPFDLHSRADLAANCLTRLLVPETGVPYGVIQLREKKLWTGATWNVPTTGHYVHGLLYTSLLSRRYDTQPALERLVENLYGPIDDGIAWTAGGAGKGENPNEAEIASETTSMLGLLTLARFFPQEPRHLATLKEMVHKHYAIALKGEIDGQPYCYFPVPVDGEGYSFIRYYRDIGWPEPHMEPISTGSAGFSGTITYPIAYYYEMTGDPVAKEFLTQFIRFLRSRAHDFNPDGSFTNGFDAVNGQVWSRVWTLHGILKFALTTGDEEMIAWARCAFDKLQAIHQTRFGWLPEKLYVTYVGCENDTLVGTLEIALLLARYVDDAYWEAAERIALNQVLEHQFRQPDVFGGPTFTHGDASAPDLQSLGEHQPKPGEGNLAMQLLGGFPSFGAPNQFFGINTYITTTANAAGATGIYDIYYHTAWWEGDDADPTLRVNMHLSKALDGATVISHLPSQAKLEIKLDTAAHVVVRMPDWAEVGEVTVTDADGGDIELNKQGRWLHLGKRGAGSHLTIDFPDRITTGTDEIWVHGPTRHVFTTQWRGNAVVAIDPAGQPNRQAFYLNREDRGPWVPQFIVENEIDPLRTR